MATNFNIKTAKFPEFVAAMEAVGYYPTDLTPLKILFSQIRRMDSVPKYEGNIIGMIADGEPGTGKSWLAQCVARLLGAEYLVYNCHPDSTQEELVSEPNAGAVVTSLQNVAQSIEELKLINSSTVTTHSVNADKVVDTKNMSRAELYNMGILLQAFIHSDTQKVVALLDELDKARPAVYVTLLTAMSEGTLYLQGWGDNGEILAVRANSQNLLIICAKNQDKELGEALYRRFPVAWIDYPPKDVEVRMIMESAGVGPAVAKYLVAMARKVRASINVRKKPSFPELKRLALDFKDIWERDCEIIETPSKVVGGSNTFHIQCSVSKQTLFNEALSTLQPRPKERDMTLQVLGLKKRKKVFTFLGTQLLSKFAQDAGKEYKIRCSSNNAIRKGK